MIKIDARGLECPQPVVKTKDALNKGEEVTTLVDNETAYKNLEKLGNKMGCDTEVLEVDDDFQITFSAIRETVTSSLMSEDREDNGEENKVYFLRSNL
jgi:TusA-related sulfurtransferase